MLSRRSFGSGHDLYLRELCPQASAGAELMPPSGGTVFLKASAKIAVINAEFPQFSLTGIHMVRFLSCHRVYTPTAENSVTLLTRVPVFLARSVHAVPVESVTPRKFPSYLQDSGQCDADLSVLRSRWPCLLLRLRGRASHRDWTQLCRVPRADRSSCSVLLVRTSMQRLYVCLS